MKTTSIFIVICLILYACKKENAIDLNNSSNPSAVARISLLIADDPIVFPSWVPDSGAWYRPKSTSQYIAKAYNYNNTELNVPISWSIDNPNIGIIDTNGLATALQVGNAFVYAEAQGIRSNKLLFGVASPTNYVSFYPYPEPRILGPNVIILKSGETWTTRVAVESKRTFIQYLDPASNDTSVVEVYGRDVLAKRSGVAVLSFNIGHLAHFTTVYVE